MSEPELIAGKWVERRDYVRGINPCGRCAFDPSKCRTARAHCDGIYFLEVKEPQHMEPTPTKPQAQPTAKQLAKCLVALSEAEDTTALLRTLMRQHAESTDYSLGLTLASTNTCSKLVLRNQQTNTTTELETAFLRQAFEVYAEALLTTLLELHTQQVTAMKAELSDPLLDIAVAYRQ